MLNGKKLIITQKFLEEFWKYCGVDMAEFVLANWSDVPPSIPILHSNLKRILLEIGFIDEVRTT